MEDPAGGDAEPPPLNLEGDGGNSSTTPKGRVVRLPSVDNDAEAEISNKDPNGTAPTCPNPSRDASDASCTSEDRSGISGGTSTLRPRLPRIQIQSYLGLPLSSMWKGRGVSSSSYASSSKSAETESQGQASDATAAPGAKNDSEDNTEGTSASGDEYEEDDRCTVRGSSVPTTPVPGTRSRRGSIAPESLLDNLKARVHLRGAVPSGVSSEIEKRPDSAEDRDTVVDPAR